MRVRVSPTRYSGVGTPLIVIPFGAVINGMLPAGRVMVKEGIRLKGLLVRGIELLIRIWLGSVETFDVKLEYGVESSPCNELRFVASLLRLLPLPKGWNPRIPCKWRGEMSIPSPTE